MTLKDFKWKPAPHTVSLPFIIAIFQSLGGWRQKAEDDTPLQEQRKQTEGEQSRAQLGALCPKHSHNLPI